jgi:demethylmenaquinone methyltransferase/2-methoxy-6-polyprenyl-1,4-benzoquinol methylase
MFDRIVPRYDLMNRIMTGGRDVAWRRIAVREALRGQPESACHVLDVATGTGDLAIALRDAGGGRVVGLDFSTPMLAAAARKDGAASVDRRVRWVQGDATTLPFREVAFDAVTVAFGLRNMPSYLGALAEMERVLRPGGTLVVLETTPFSVPALRTTFDWYFSHVVPIIGGILSGDSDAYRYLPASAAAFPDAETLGRMMVNSGFSHVRYLRLGMGSVALHVAIKPAPALRKRGRPGESDQGLSRPSL